MEFRYQKRQQSINPFAPLLLKPLVEVHLSHDHRSVKLWALIDSGADMSIFHSSLAPVLGIELTAGLRQQFMGITSRLDGYLHEVTLKVIGLDDPITMAVAFGELEGASAILGQADFFQHYQITFERYNERIKILPRMKLDHALPESGRS